MSADQDNSYSIRRGTVRSGRFELAWSVEGTGKPVLVIGSAVYYPRTFSRELRRRVQLVFADHRGFAAAEGATAASDFAFDRVLDDIELVRRALGFDVVAVAGHSGHAYMALEYAKRFPEHVSHVIMIAAGASLSAENHALTERRWAETVDPTRKARLAAEMALLPADIEAAPERAFVAFCLRMGARTWADPTFDAAPLWEGVRVHAPAFDYLWGEVFRDIDVAEGLENLHTPVFLALGHFDHLVPPEFTWEPLRPAFRDLTVRVFAHSGHCPQLEESDRFDVELLAWLGREAT